MTQLDPTLCILCHEGRHLRHLINDEAELTVYRTGTMTVHVSAHLDPDAQLDALIEIVKTHHAMGPASLVRIDDV